MPSFPGYGLIMAGGKSSRMGQDKANLIFRGNTLLSQSYHLLSEFCRHGVLVSCSKHNLYAGYRCLPDAVEGLGPISGLASYFNRYSFPVFVLAVDLPLVDKNILSILEQKRKLGRSVIVAQSSYSTQPLCAIYEYSCAKIIRQQIERQSYAMFALLERLDTEYVDVSDEALLNVNRPDDLLRVREME